MRYLALIYRDEAVVSQWGQNEINAEYAGYMSFNEEAQKRGVLTDNGEALQPVHTATTVRVRDGKTLVTEGPFAETKERLGGFYLLNCQNLDEAIELATKIPAVTNGSIEIRPIMEFE